MLELVKKYPNDHDLGFYFRKNNKSDKLSLRFMNDSVLGSEIRKIYNREKELANLVKQAQHLNLGY